MPAPYKRFAALSWSVLAISWEVNENLMVVAAAGRLPLKGGREGQSEKHGISANGCSQLIMTLGYIVIPRKFFSQSRMESETAVAEYHGQTTNSKDINAVKIIGCIISHYHVLTRVTIVRIPKLIAGCHSPRFPSPLPLRDTKLNELGECFREAMVGSATASKRFIITRHSLAKELLFVIGINVNVLLEGLVFNERHIRTV